MSTAGRDSLLEVPFDLYGMTVCDTAADVREGDIVVNLPRSRRYVRNERDFIRVTRVDDGDVYGYRVFPQEWEREVEFVIVEAQVGSGLTIVERAS